MCIKKSDGRDHHDTLMEDLYSKAGEAWQFESFEWKGDGDFEWTFVPRDK